MKYANAGIETRRAITDWVTAKAVTETEASVLAKEATVAFGVELSTRAAYDMLRRRGVEVHMNTEGSQYRRPSEQLAGLAADDELPPPVRRRCKNKFCINRFTPTNSVHMFCSTPCRDAEYQWTDQEILQEEGTLFSTSSPLELAKRAFGQKNQLQRKVDGLLSLRDWLRFSVEDVMSRYPDILIKPGPIEQPVMGKRSPKKIILVCSDWQIGKLENGIGVNEMVEGRIPRILSAVIQIVEHFRSAGHPVSEIHVVFVGDMVEGCWIYKGQNVTGLDRTGNSHFIMNQVLLTSELQAKLVVALAGRVERLVVHSVPGNHGRTNGKNDFSDARDNFDTLCAFIAKEKAQLQKNIEWDIQDDWYGTFPVLEDHGPVVALHGDKFAGDTMKLRDLIPNWYTSGLFGPVKPMLVLAAHRHEFVQMEANGIPVVQNGTIDGGSRWYQQAYGRASRPIQTVLVVSEKHGVEATYPVYFK